MMVSLFSPPPNSISSDFNTRGQLIVYGLCKGTQFCFMVEFQHIQLVNTHTHLTVLTPTC